MSNIILIAPPNSRRVRAFQASLAELGRPPARVVPYLPLLRGETHLGEWVKAGDIVRFESTGEDLDTERALIELGGGTPTDLAAGELAPMREWYAGFSAALRGLDAQLKECPPHRRMQVTDHILTMFDKPATHQRLQAAGVSVPEALPEAGSAAVLAAARERGWSRLFVKLAYGSSASGAVALQWQGERVLAVTTVRMEGGRLFNSRSLVKYDTWADVHALLDALAPHRLHTEQWWPKASFGGKTIDLRVVVIGGRAQHTLVRSARGPITNLHLGNERGDVEALRNELGERWQMVEDVAESASNAFPDALYAGVDVLLTPSWKRAAVLEVNAFGDYHRGVLVNDLDTYQAELAALEWSLDA